jgi:hypothetical protein
MADLTEDDVRAMKKCFYDAMQEAMEIGPCWELQLEEIKNEPEPEVTDLPAWNLEKYEPSLEELLMMPMRHISDVEKCFEACKSRLDVQKVLQMVPNMFGEWLVEFDDEYKIFTIVNTYSDEDGEYEEEYCYDYPEDWDYDTEWDFDEEGED